MESKRIAVIGAGNMGGALLRGMLKSTWSSTENFVASSRNEVKLAALEAELGIRTTTDNAEAARDADVILLGVKPQIMRKVVHEIRDVVTPENLVVSIAAGTTTGAIEKYFGKDVRLVRSMPNVPATVDLGATAICRGAQATTEDMAIARAIFESVGIVVEVEEYLMDAVTGLSGTGPMYIFQIIEGLSDAGVRVGLSREVANALTVQTVLGAAKMVELSTEHPARLKDRVTSPGGTAIAALHSLERNGLRAVLMDAVEAAVLRAEELGRRADAED